MYPMCHVTYIHPHIYFKYTFIVIQLLAANKFVEYKWTWKNQTAELKLIRKCLYYEAKIPSS